MNKLIGAQNIEITYENHILTAKILGDIDHHSARSVREKIDALIFSKRPSMVVLDLSAVEFMDSSGLGLIVGRLRVAYTWQVHKRNGGRRGVFDI